MLDAVPMTDDQVARLVRLLLPRPRGQLRTASIGSSTFHVERRSPSRRSPLARASPAPVSGPIWDERRTAHLKRDDRPSRPGDARARRAPLSLIPNSPPEIGDSAT